MKFSRGDVKVKRENKKKKKGKRKRKSWRPFFVGEINYLIAGGAARRRFVCPFVYRAAGGGGFF